MDSLQYLQMFWGASGNYWQSHWEVIHGWFGGDERKMALIGTYIVTNIVFFVWNLLFIIPDLTGYPQCLLKYKMQPKKNCPVPPKLFAKALRRAIFNQTVAGIPVFMLFYKAMVWRGCSFGTELPTFHRVLFELAVFSLVLEFFFYYGHRLLHHPWFYKHIHKIHHEWTSPIGISALYAHPIEHILTTMLPCVMGPFLLGSHIGTAWLWFCLALMSTTISHCGYHFPLLPSPEAHDFHHLKFINNFGVLGVLDRLHGTDSLFRASNTFQRHVMLLSLTPLSVQYPDNLKSPNSAVAKGAVQRVNPSPG